ncbi:MAG: alpha/beta hydrolase [Chitinophagales bacterium]|nr:alpha/beta hydrolase [Chitinophagales bacterium]
MLKLILLLLVGLPLLALIAFRFAGPLFDPTSSGKDKDKLFEGKKAPEHHFTTYKGIPLHYAQVGDSLPATVIFVHGSPGSWDGWVNFLADTSLTSRANIIAIDRPGYGKSNPNVPLASVKEHADAWADLLKASQQQGKVILVGHSYGGPIVARMAMDHPEWVDAVVIVAGSISPEVEKHQWYNQIAKWKVVSWLLPPMMATSNEEMWPLKEQLEEMLPLWDKLTMPVTVIQGTEDGLVDPLNADFAEKVIKSKELKVQRYPKTGHLIPWKRPELITNAVLEMLQVE